MTSASLRAVIAGCLAGAATLCATPARAEVERFALLIASNQGASDEQTLRFAESDAEKLRDVLTDLGGFRQENVVLLARAGADATRTALITINDRIRTLPAGADAVLLVYYSGHADASSLHLGGTTLPLVELERLVRGSAAAIRLLILDACRSGSLTRVKGARRAPEFQIQLGEQLVSQGAVFLTSSAANEDAQESDDLRGSFFTHYLVSGLLGAADANGDHKVSLSEAYRYAYESTLRASSRTLAGPQHPTFRFNLAGRGDIVLTNLAGSPGQQRAWLRFPPDRGYLVLRGDIDGTVVAEVGPRDRRRHLSVRPGRYFVRGRGRSYLLEGTVDAVAGLDRSVIDDDLERIAYARLVRKGGGGLLDMVHGPSIGVRGRSALVNSRRPCLGGFLGYLVETPNVDLGVRAGWCRAGYENGLVDAAVDEFDLELLMRKVWDVGPLSIGPEVAFGGGVLSQRFTSVQTSPARRSAMGHVGAGLVIGVELGGGVSVGLDAIVETYLFRQREKLDELGASSGFRLQLAAGWRL